MMIMIMVVCVRVRREIERERGRGEAGVGGGLLPCVRCARACNNELNCVGIESLSLITSLSPSLSVTVLCRSSCLRPSAPHCCCCDDDAISSPAFASVGVLCDKMRPRSLAHRRTAARAPAMKCMRTTSAPASRRHSAACPLARRARPSYRSCPPPGAVVVDVAAAAKRTPSAARTAVPSPPSEAGSPPRRPQT